MGDELRFLKYQATGNDFVMTSTSTTSGRSRPRRWPGSATGGSGSAPTASSDSCAARRSSFMDYRNADGSLAEMCGNGIRCVARLRSTTTEDGRSFDVETSAGARRVDVLADGRVSGRWAYPTFTKAAIPMRGPAWETFLAEPLDVGGGLTVTASAVSMGNPHLVLFVDDDPDRFHVAHIGAVLERDDLFPEGENVEFAHVVEDDVAARVGAGSGETMACGSGACAVAVAANEAGLVPARTVMRFPGGDLEVERDGRRGAPHGTRERVYESSVDLDDLR